MNSCDNRGNWANFNDAAELLFAGTIKFPTFVQRTRSEVTALVRKVTRSRRPPTWMDEEDLVREFEMLLWHYFQVYAQVWGGSDDSPDSQKARAKFRVQSRPGLYLRYSASKRLQKFVSAARNEDQHRRDPLSAKMEIPADLSGAEVPLEERSSVMGRIERQQIATLPPSGNFSTMPPPASGLEDVGAANDAYFGIDSMIDRSKKMLRLAAMADTEEEADIAQAFAASKGSEAEVVDILLGLPADKRSRMGIASSDDAMRAIDGFVSGWVLYNRGSSRGNRSKQKEVA